MLPRLTIGTDTASLLALAVEIVAAHANESEEKVRQRFSVQPGYPTPKVDVRAACFRDGIPPLSANRTDTRHIVPNMPPALGRIGSPTVSTGRQFFVKLSYLLRF